MKFKFQCPQIEFYWDIIHSFIYCLHLCSLHYDRGESLRQQPYVVLSSLYTVAWCTTNCSDTVMIVQCFEYNVYCHTTTFHFDHHIKTKREKYTSNIMLLMFKVAYGLFCYWMKWQTTVPHNDTIATLEKFNIYLYYQTKYSSYSQFVGK